MPASLNTPSYCGPSPLPDDLWGRWNFDPVLLAIMMMAIGAFVFGHAGSARERSHFLAGMTVLAIIFVSPLCALTVALFSARVAHHVLLVAVAAPLLAWSMVGRIRARHAELMSGLLVPLLGLHTIIFWLWHAPDAYGLALTSTPAYWVMQVSLLLSAALFWTAVWLASPARAVAALLATTVQMGLLGALLVFSDQPLYWPHFATTMVFGLDARTDQQMAGLIMWVPASLPYLLVAVVRLSGWLRQSEARRA